MIPFIGLLARICYKPIRLILESWESRNLIKPASKLTCDGIWLYDIGDEYRRKNVFDSTSITQKLLDEISPGVALSGR